MAQSRGHAGENLVGQAVRIVDVSARLERVGHHRHVSVHHSLRSIPSRVFARIQSEQSNIDPNAQLHLSALSAVPQIRSLHLAEFRLTAASPASHLDLCVSEET